MGTVQSLIAQGYGGYAGWSDEAAAQDFQATGGAGKFTGSVGGGGGFGFDFESEVDKAFEDLGQYYSELLSESNEDLDLALARMEEDFQTGNRFRRQTMDLSQEALDIAREATAENAEILRERNIANLQRRGLFRQTMRGGDKQLGVGDVQTQRVESAITRGLDEQDLAQRRLETGFAQEEELAETGIERGRVDVQRGKERVTRELEERRKREAGELAMSRAQRAFKRFETGLI